MSLQNAALLGVDHAGIFVDSPSKDLRHARNRENGEEFSLDDDSITRLIKLRCDAKMFVLLTGSTDGGAAPVLPNIGNAG